MQARKFAPVAAGVLAVALMLPGGTFSLWGAGTATDPATITSGNLKAEKVGSAEWVNPSDGSPASMSLVPGETVAITQDFDVALQGDQLRARVRVSVLNSDGDAVPVPAGYTATYQLLDGSGTPISQEMTAGSAPVTPAGAALLLNAADYPDALDSVKDVSALVKVTLGDGADPAAIPASFRFDLAQER